MNASKESLVRRIFSFDTRSLAVFRISLGVVLLIDLAMRWGTLEAMQADSGILSLQTWSETVAAASNTPDPLGWSLHAVNGSLTWQIVLFVVALVSAALLTLGWFTRIATIVSWILLVSLHTRNPLILHSGDTFLRLLLFWGMFLPLGSMWSLDRKRKRDNEIASPLRICSGATVGLLLSIFSLYFFAGIAKLNDVWFSGQAIAYVLQLDIYTTDIGRSMRGSTSLLKLFTWATLIGEILVPFFLFIAWRNDLFRWFCFVFFVGLHIGIALCMDIGLFSYISIAAWLVVIPTSFWNRWSKQSATDSKTTNRQDVVQPQPVNWLSLTNLVLLFFAGYFLLWNAANIEHPFFKKLMPQSARVIGRWTNLRQAFTMFDVPPEHSPWFVYDARLASGLHVDIFRGKPVDHERPDSVHATIPSHHWRRLHRNLVRSNFAKYRVPIVEYMVRRWNANHGKDGQVVTCKTIAYLDEISLDAEYSGTASWVWHVHGAQAAEESVLDDVLKKMKDKGIILP